MASAKKSVKGQVATSNRYSDLVKIDGHQHYYQNPMSKKITFRRMHKGESIKIATGKTTIRDAKTFVEFELRRRATGEAPEKITREIQGVKNPMVSDIWKECVADRIQRGRQGTTVTTYRTNWKHGLEPFWGHRTVKDLNDRNLERFRDWYWEHRASRQFVPKYLIMLINYCVRAKYIPERPNLEPLKEINPLIRSRNKVEEVGRVATPAEQEKLLGAWKLIIDSKRAWNRPSSDREVGYRTRLLILLGLRYGMRKMEAGKLERERFDLRKNVFKVWSAKNSEWREIPLVQDVREAYQDWIEIAPLSSWVFPSKRKPTTHMASQILDRGWVRARKLAGVDDLRFHDLRHTFASFTADEGWPPLVACDLLDMSLKVYQDTYCKVSLNRKRQLLDSAFFERSKR